MSEIFFFGYMVDCKMCYSVFGLVKCLVRRGKRSCVVKWLLRCVRCISLLVWLRLLAVLKFSSLQQAAINHESFEIQFSHRRFCRRLYHLPPFNCHLCFVSECNTKKQPNNQTKKQTNKETSKKTNKQNYRKSDKHINRQTEQQKIRQTDKETNRQTNKQTKKQRNKQPNKQTNKQTDN